MMKKKLHKETERGADKQGADEDRQEDIEYTLTNKTILKTYYSNTYRYCYNALDPILQVA